MTSESKQVGEPGQTPPLAVPEAEAPEAPSTAVAVDKGKKKAPVDEKQPKASAKDLQEKLRALLDSNPEWKEEAKGMSPERMQDFVTSKFEQMMRGASGRNAKEMGEFKFWGTQPVPKFGELGRAVIENLLQLSDWSGN